MSENIPLEIQMEIVERICEVKWVIQYRMVSRAWKSRIDSKEFVTAHTRRHSHDDDDHRLLVKKRIKKKGPRYFSIVDNDTLPHQERKLFLPFSVERLGYTPMIVEACHGLIFFEAFPYTFVWNPSIGKAVHVAIKRPENYGDNYKITLGFGVCPSTLDPKLVKITHVYLRLPVYGITSTYVEVFTLGSVRGTWRSSNFPHKSIEIEGYSRAVIKGVIYWDAVVDRITVGSEVVSTNHRNLIMSFDFTSEEFSQVNIPDHLALDPYARFYLYNVRESLVVIESNANYNRVLWMMIGHGCTRSFNRLYSFAVEGCSIFGFRKNGAPIIEYDDDNSLDLVGMYEPKSKHISETATLKGTSFVHSYKETLLLLGH